MAAHAPTIRRWTAIGLTLLAAGGLAACGSSDDDNGSTSSGATSGGAAAGGGYGGGATTMPKTTAAAGGGGATNLALAADELGADRLAFSRSDLSATAGRVTIALDNPSGNQLPHAVEVEGNGVEQESEIVQPGNDASVTAQLRPGRYTFYCPVGNHRELGMEGTLTVR
jgi:uncharacterized cupredoxin-like copper-binding protein